MGKDGRTLACLESSNAPLSCSLPRLPFPGRHPIQAFSRPPFQRSWRHLRAHLSYCLKARLGDLQEVGGLLLLLTSPSGPSSRSSFLFSRCRWTDHDASGDEITFMPACQHPQHLSGLSHLADGWIDGWLRTLSAGTQVKEGEGAWGRTRGHNPTGDSRPAVL